MVRPIPSLDSGLIPVIRTIPVDEAVRLDLDALISSKYELIVLRPALHDAELQLAFAALVAETRSKYFEAVRCGHCDYIGNHFLAAPCRPAHVVC